jgi:hypothetical protein
MKYILPLIAGTLFALSLTGIHIYDQSPVGRVSVVFGFTEDNEIAVILSHADCWIVTPAEGRAQECVELSDYTDADICDCYANEGLNPLINQ